MDALQCEQIKNNSFDIMAAGWCFLQLSCDLPSDFVTPLSERLTYIYAFLQTDKQTDRQTECKKMMKICAVILKCEGLTEIECRCGVYVRRR